MGKDAPESPDPMQTASTQYDLNKTAASDTMKMNALSQTNPVGPSPFTYDSAGNPTGVTSQLTGDLATGAANLGSAYTNYTSQLPTSSFDSTGIAATDELSKTFYDKGSALLEDDFGQARTAQDVQLTNRGLPIGSEARTIAEGNLAKQQSLALSDLASQASLLAPAEQQRLIDNARSDYQMQFSNVNSIGDAYQQLATLVPTANQPSASVSSGNYQDAAYKNYQGETDAYNSEMAGYGALAKTAAGLALTPVTGGLSNSLIGSMFN